MRSPVLRPVHSRACKSPTHYSSSRPQAPAHHLDTHYTIFGELVSGWPVAEAINALSRDKKDNTATQEDGAKIVDSGQIRKGTIVPDLNKP